MLQNRSKYNVSEEGLGKGLILSSLFFLPFLLILLSPLFSFLFLFLFFVEVKVLFKRFLGFIPDVVPTSTPLHFVCHPPVCIF